MKTSQTVRRTLFASCLLHAAVALGGDARNLVCVARSKAGPGLPRMQLHSIGVREFAPEPGFNGFADALEQAGLLFVKKKARYAFEELMGSEANRRAIKALLARGGTVWFGRVSSGGKPIREFLAALGVEAPGEPSGQSKQFVVNPTCESPLLSSPNRQSEGARGWQSWPEWPAGLEALMATQDAPGEAGLLLASGVQGKGRIFFTTIDDAWALGSTFLAPLVANILHHTFGPLPGPGEAHAVCDPFQARDPLANTTRLHHAGRAEWHAPDARRRKAFLISEPIGMARRAACVEVDWPSAFEGAADAQARDLRAFTAGGVELHAQTLGAGRIALNAPLSKYDDRLVYVYTGGAGAPDVRDGKPFSLQKRQDGWLLRNDHFEALLAPELPALLRIRVYGGSDNALMTWGAAERWQGYGTNFAVPRRKAVPYKRAEARVIADGAVRKTVRYEVEFEERDLIVEVSLVRGGRALFWCVRSRTAHGLRLETGWSPGGSLMNDSLWYEAADGLKRLPLFQKPASHYQFGKYAKESWYAVVDDKTGEAGGGFVERDDKGRFSMGVYSHFVHGQMISQAIDATPRGISGGWVAAANGAKGVRCAYLAWRWPPVVTPGPEQPRDAAPAPALPAFGRDFLLMHGSFRRFFPVNAKTGLDAWADCAMDIVRERAGNVAEMGGHLVPENYPPFMGAARKRGMAVCLVPNVRRLGCTLANREKYLEATREQTRYKAEIYYLLDEFSHNCACEVCKADFKRKTGLALPEKLDVSTLPDEATNQAVLWRMDLLTELVREMDAIVKAARADALTFVCTAPTQMSHEIGTLNDLETWSAFIGTTASDLYSTDFAAVRFGLQFIRGAQGNRKPVLGIHGATFTARDLYVNLGAHLMNGANALWFFSLGWHRFGRDVQAPVIREYEILRETGLGGFLAKARPLRYAAVLCERASLLAGIRRGELRNSRALYHDYVEKQASLRNVPVDILFAGRLAEELPGYRVLVVPSGRDVSASSAAAVERWVRTGGRVIVEGESLLTPALASLCGVSVSAEAGSPAEQVEGRAGPLAGAAFAVNTRWRPLTSAGASVLAVAPSGAPVVTTHKAGEGVAVAIGLVDVPHDLTRRLAVSLGGTLPVELDAASHPDVRLATLSDGRRTAVGLFNEHFSDARAAVVTLNDVAPAGKRTAVNLHHGTQQPVAETLQVRLPAKTWNFVLVEPASQAPAVPPPGTFTQAPAYAGRAGMDFLKLTEEKPAAKRKKVPGFIYVGVVKNRSSSRKPVDYGGEAILRGLRDQKGLAAEFATDLSPETISFYDVLIVPNMVRPGPNLGTAWEKHVREFVLAGGGALLVHHSAGYKDTASPLFPEVATAGTYIPVRGMKVVADHPVVNARALEEAFPTERNDPAFAAGIARHKLAVGRTFNSGFPDYIRLVPGPAGAVVVRSLRSGDLGGDPTLVAGAAGQGRVVLSGMDIGAKCDKQGGRWVVAESLSPEEESVLLNAVFWLAQ